MDTRFSLPQGVAWDKSVVCSPTREQLVTNLVNYLTFYSLMGVYSEIGNRNIQSAIKERGGNEETKIRLSLNSYEYQGTAADLRSNYPNAIQEMGHLLLIALYGSFEAFLIGLILEAGNNISNFSSEDFIRERISRRNWRARFNNIDMYLKVPLGENVFNDKFKTADMRFSNHLFTNPIDFLLFASKLRNLLVHNAGETDEEFRSSYPAIQFATSRISVAFGFPYQIGLFYLHMSEVLDQAFSNKLGWPTKTVNLDAL